MKSRRSSSLDELDEVSLPLLRSPRESANGWREEERAASCTRPRDQSSKPEIIPPKRRKGRRNWRQLSCSAFRWLPNGSRLRDLKQPSSAQRTAIVLVMKIDRRFKGSRKALLLAVLFFFFFAFQACAETSTICKYFHAELVLSKIQNLYFRSLLFDFSPHLFSIPERRQIDTFHLCSLALDRLPRPICIP